MQFSQLAVSPLYIIVVLMSIGYLIFCIKEKGCLAALYKIIAILHVCIYIVSLYLFIIGK